MVFFVVIVVANLYFFVLWTYKMIGEIRSMMLRKFSKLYLIICVCGHQKKLEE